MTKLTGVQMAATAFDAGFASDNLYIACAVAHAESGWNTTSRYVTSKEDSRGLFQINTYAHPDADKNHLYEAVYNAKYAYGLWRRSGWRPWTTYTRGTYKQSAHWNAALAAVQALISLGWNIGSHPPSSPPASSGSTGLTPSPSVAPFSWGEPVVAQVASFNGVTENSDGWNALFSELYR